MKIEDFKCVAQKLIDAGNEAVVDINRVFGLPNSSPFSLQYVSRNIHVFDRFPEGIVFCSEASVMQINRISKIAPVRGYVQTYVIFCDVEDGVNLTIQVQFRPQKREIA